MIPGDVGNSFRVNPNTTARKGEYAYYSIEVYNADNQKVDPGTNKPEQRLVCSSCYRKPSDAHI